MSYFEFEDVKRFHQPYTDPIQKSPVWKTPYHNNMVANMKRAAIATTQVALVWTPIHHVYDNTWLLNQFYEWPRTRAEYNIFFREVFRVPNFWRSLFTKTAWNTVHYAGDIGAKLAVWQLIFGGTMSYAEYADYNAFKYVFCGILAGVATCWTGIPFEMAKRAYYADKTWPLEMRRGYRSPFNAMLRIPFEEGPSYLFKGSFPIIARDYMLVSGFFTTYVWLKNKMFFMWIYNGFSYEYCKFVMMVGSWAFAMALSYPCHFAREMVDLWPKERGGH